MELISSMSGPHTTGNILPMAPFAQRIHLTKKNVLEVLDQFTTL